MEDADLSLKQALANGKKVVVRESDYAATQPFHSFGDLLFDHIYVKELVLYCCIASSFHSDIFPCVLGWLCGELLSFRDTCGELLHSSPAEVLGRLVGYLKLGRVVFSFLYLKKSKFQKYMSVSKILKIYPGHPMGATGPKCNFFL